MKTSKQFAPQRVSKVTRYTLAGALLLAVAACSKDSSDGEVISARPLPLGDIVLNLFCEDFGLFQETCVLDDPDNPFATVAITNENRFDLVGEIDAQVAAIPLPPDAAVKTKVYFWATALAKGSDGENQYRTANALYALANESCSQLIQDQALRAYRSVLDNYFNSVTFFATDDFGAPFPNVFYPFPLKLLAANELRLGIGPADASCAGTGYSEFMFDPDAGRNDFVARVVLNDWGYIFDDTPLSLIKK